MTAIHTDECRNAMYRGSRLCICGASNREEPAATGPLDVERLARAFFNTRQLGNNDTGWEDLLPEWQEDEIHHTRQALDEYARLASQSSDREALDDAYYLDVEHAESAPSSKQVAQPAELPGE